MGKIRVAALGDEQQENEQKKKAEVRRQAKAAKKASTSDATEEKKAVNQVEETSSAENGAGESKKQKNKTLKVKVRSKRYQELAALVDKNKLYSVTEGVALVKKTSKTAFDGTVEIHLNLAIQMLGNKTDYRGKVNLPHGTGNKITVAIADDELLKKLEAGTIDFDVLVAHPTMMAKLAKYARVLGPKGLMPNPKNGTVSPDPEKRAKELTHGEVNFKTEPNNPIVHLGIGKVSFEEKQLSENIQALILSIGKNKISKATINSTMGPGVHVDVSVL